jgi:type I restriction-modification system DNA methylase subunit
MPRPRDSEVDAYAFIKEHLALHSWVVRNPNRVASGQVWTQTECLDVPEIKRFLKQTHPENIVKVTETELYVIEAKRDKDKIGVALQEAEEDYANKINQSRTLKARIISGVAGNSTDGFIVESRFLKNGKFHPIVINGRGITGFVSPSIARLLLENDSPEIADLPVDETIFLKSAEEINEILHLGAINKNQRARVMGALLLSMVDDTRPNVDAAPTVLIQEINSRAQNILMRNGKPEFFECIRITLPPSKDNHFKFKSALVQTIQHLEDLNIRSAMNSGTDVLGKFYEVFLKYGNGAKEIGIVLTPRHITRFAAEALSIGIDDIIYDPTCGTGGFLVAAYDLAKKSAKPEDIDFFKNNALFGIEQEPEVAALAVVNMIFRGDGKNNILEGNCFQKSLISRVIRGRPSGKIANNSDLPNVHTPAATKVLMNPPFALKKSDEKEYKFIDHALEQLKDGGVLFSVLPYSVLVKGQKYLKWRKDILTKHSLLCVITFPEDMFYPIGVHTVGIFLLKGKTHPTNQKVLWIRAINDGYLKSKGKRLENARATNDYPKIKTLIHDFITDQTIAVKNVMRFQKSAKIDFSDGNFELVPEAYLDQEEPTIQDIQKEMERVMRDTAAFLIKNSMERKHD